MNKLRVLLVDDEIMIREGFKRLFDWEVPRLPILLCTDRQSQHQQRKE